jgi:hypothetical protein
MGTAGRPAFLEQDVLCREVWKVRAANLAPPKHEGDAKTRPEKGPDKEVRKVVVQELLELLGHKATSSGFASRVGWAAGPPAAHHM